MAIPKIKREAYDGKLDHSRFNSVPANVRYLYCNCGGGITGNVVLLTSVEPTLDRNFGFLHCGRFEAIAVIDKLPIITDKHQRMCVEVV